MRFYELYESDSDLEKKKKELIALVKKSDSPVLIQTLGQKVTSFLQRMNPFRKREEPEKGSGEEAVEELPETVVFEDMAATKEELIRMIQQIDDPVELDTLYSLAKKADILEKSKKYFMKKFGSLGDSMDRWFASLILDTTSTFEEKEQFLDTLLQSNGLFEGKDLLKKKTGSFDNLIKTKNSIYDQIKTTILKKRGQLGFGPDQGPMELFLVLFGRNIGLASKGDLEIGDQIVELKASQKGKSGLVGGRPVGTSGYGTPAGVKDKFMEKLVELGADPEMLEETTVHLNYKGFKNINDILSNNNVRPAQTKELIDVIMKGLYTKMDQELIDPVYKSINSDGTIDIEKFIKAHVISQIIYYKQIEGFDYLLIANSDSTNYVLIKDQQDAEKLYGQYKPSALINWNESRGGAAANQLIVR